jgi:probable rRNA maturation factor
MLDVDWSGVDMFDFSVEKIEKWLQFVCESEDKTLDELAIVFKSDDGLLEMNNRFLNHDYFTDIITFDYCEENNVSGDLFISVDRVRDNSALEGVSFQDELNRVIVHGVLHLCGYGDKGDEEPRMRMKEDLYLNKLKGFT